MGHREIPFAKDDVTLGTATSACGKAGQWEHALLLSNLSLNVQRSQCVQKVPVQTHSTILAGATSRLGFSSEERFFADGSSVSICESGAMGPGPEQFGLSKACQCVIPRCMFGSWRKCPEECMQQLSTPPNHVTVGAVISARCPHHF